VETVRCPKYHYEEVNDDGTIASFLTEGYMPVLATSAVAIPTEELEMEVASPDPPVASPTSPVNPWECQT
jgi:hypothetical protein